MTISDFIQQCAGRDIVSPDQIKQAALDRIKQIDTLLTQQETLRIERADMLSVVKSFGDEKRSRVPIIMDDTSIDKLDAVTLNYAAQICVYITEHQPGQDIMPRELMTRFGVTTDKDYEIYNTIKWLCGQGICGRMPNGSLCKGPKWETRPKK